MRQLDKGILLPDGTYDETLSTIGYASWAHLTPEAQHFAEVARLKAEIVRLNAVIVGLSFATQTAERTEQRVQL